MLNSMSMSLYSPWAKRRPRLDEEIVQMADDGIRDAGVGPAASAPVAASGLT
jgi:hypothetical protein